MCVRGVFVKVEFKCPLAAAIGRHELEQDGKMEAAQAGLAVKL